MGSEMCIRDRAGLIPIVVGIASIAIAVGMVAMVGQAVQFSFFVTNMISMMGLAVGIDYSLFVVSRYREERERGREKLDAIEATGATASRAVFFSGMTVVLALVGGETAFNKDFFDVADRYLPIVFVFVLGLSFVLLTVAFRSIVVPAKAIVMNLLSVGAAYGLIVLVSQKGVGAGVLGFQQVEVIEAWLPLFLFSVLFGLSMDYHVFLLSRIREHFDLTGDNTESVAYGLRTTAGIITGAALIMVAVFGGFAAGRMVAFQQMGFGLAMAVLIDATIVRSVLVPASMKLLGRRNWYLPPWLEWLPHLGVEGPATHVVDLRAPAPAADGTTAPSTSGPGDAPPPVVPVAAATGEDEG